MRDIGRKTRSLSRETFLDVSDESQEGGGREDRGLTDDSVWLSSREERKIDHGCYPWAVFYTVCSLSKKCDPETAS